MGWKLTQKVMAINSETDLELAFMLTCLLMIVTTSKVKGQNKILILFS